jgi:hypothetical protein
MAPQLGLLPKTKKDIGSRSGGGGGIYYGANAKMFGVVTKCMIGHTTFNGRDYVKLAKLVDDDDDTDEEEKKNKDDENNKRNELSFPVSTAREVLDCLKKWRVRILKWQSEIEKGGSNLFKAIKREDFVSKSIGKEPFVARDQRFTVEGAKTPLHAMTLFLIHDRDEDKPYIHPIPAFALSRSPGMKYQQKVDFIDMADIDKFLSVFDKFLHTHFPQQQKKKKTASLFNKQQVVVESSDSESDEESSSEDDDIPKKSTTVKRKALDSEDDEEEEAIGRKSVGSKQELKKSKLILSSSSDGTDSSSSSCDEKQRKKKQKKETKYIAVNQFGGGSGKKKNKITETPAKKSKN